MAVVGIVAEGTHDFLMLEPLIRMECAKRSVDDIILKPLQPAPDATGKMADGGCGRVLGWCEKYAGNKIDTFFNPIFAGDVACDIIIVHLDGDALELMSPHTSVVVPAGQLTVADRVKLVVNALESILLPKDRREKLAFAVPVQHTEAWILAVENFHGNPSCIDAKAEFRKSYNYRKTKIKKYYKDKVSAATKNAWSAPVCVSYKAFSAEIEAVKL